MGLVTDALKILKEQAIRELTAKAVAQAVIRWSFLGNPIINPLVVKIIEWVLDFIFDEGETLAFYGYTHYLVNHQKDAVYDAISANIQNPSETTKLALINRARDLIKLRSQAP